MLAVDRLFYNMAMSIRYQEVSYFTHNTDSVKLKGKLKDLEALK